MLFVRRSSSRRLNWWSRLHRRLLDSELAVRVSHPRILERITLKNLQHVRGVTWLTKYLTSRMFKTLVIPSISWREALANLPFHVRDLLISSRGEWRPSGPLHIPPTLKELKTKSKANPGNREIRKSRENPKICNIIYFLKNRKQIPNMARTYLATWKSINLLKLRRYEDFNIW